MQQQLRPSPMKEVNEDRSYVEKLPTVWPQLLKAMEKDVAVPITPVDGEIDRILNQLITDVDQRKGAVRDLLTRRRRTPSASWTPSGPARASRRLRCGEHEITVASPGGEGPGAWPPTTGPEVSGSPVGPSGEGQARLIGPYAGGVTRSSSPAAAGPEGQRSRRARRRVGGGEGASSRRRARAGPGASSRLAGCGVPAHAGQGDAAHLRRHPRVLGMVWQASPGRVARSPR